MNKKKYISFIVAVFLLCMVQVAGTLAYLTATSDDGPLVNTFVAAKFLLDEEGTFVLAEHEAILQEDGSYVLDETSVVQANTYELRSGVDVPKDPYITITGKTKEPAYLYLKVKDSLNTNVNWNIDSTNWRYILSSDGWNVYVYAPDQYNAQQVTSDVSNVNIIKNQTILVNDVEDLEIAEEGITLSFESCLAQVSAGTDAKEVYNNCFGS